MAARFTLDALPGKQMAIDADLNAGLIDEDEARKRREEIAREADFYGAMDGASKFVRGDAIAGLVITAVNIIGGFLIGVFQHGMSAAEAAQNFVLLSIGDGLVSQIPALLISTAAGIIVSRASGEANLAEEFKGQLFGRSYPLLITGSFLALLGLVPGLPLVPFWLLAGTTLLLGYQRRQFERREKEKPAQPEAQEPEPRPSDDPGQLLMVDPLELEIGYGLIPLVDPNQHGDLLDRIKVLRQQLALELGIVIPPVRIRDNMALGANRYVIKIRGNPVTEARCSPATIWRCCPKAGRNAAGAAHDGSHLRPAGALGGRTQPARCRAHGADRGRSTGRHHHAPARGAPQKRPPAAGSSGSQKAARQSQRNPPGADRGADAESAQHRRHSEGAQAPAARAHSDPRSGLDPGGAGRSRHQHEKHRRTDRIRAPCAGPHHHPAIPVAGRRHLCFVLDPILERHLLQQAEAGELHPGTLGLEPRQSERFLKEAERITRRLLSEGRPPVLLTSPVLRPVLYNFLAPSIPDLNVLSYNDLLPDTRVEVVDQLRLP